MIRVRSYFSLLIFYVAVRFIEYSLTPSPPVISTPEKRYFDYDAAVQVEVKRQILVVHSVTKPMDIYYDNTNIVSGPHKDPLWDESVRMLKLATKKEMEAYDSAIIKKHEQHYRMLRIAYPEVEFLPSFIGQNAIDGIRGTFIFGMQELFAKFVRTTKPEWLLLMPNRNSILFDVKALNEKMDMIADDALIVCLVGMVGYNMTEQFEDSDTQGEKMGNWIEQILDDIIPGWYIDNNWLKAQTFTHGCMGDTFLIRTQAMEHIVNMGYAFYPLQQQIDRLLTIGNSLGNLARISFWIFSLLTHPIAKYSSFANPSNAESGFKWRMHALEHQSELQEETLPIGTLVELDHKVDILRFDSELQIDVIKEKTLPKIYSENVNQETIPYLVEPKTPCQEKVPLIALIKTSYHGKIQREMIRNMFSEMLSNSTYHLYFLLGFDRAEKMGYRHGYFVKTESIKTNVYQDKMIQDERLNHNDLIIGDFEDNYENLPIKTLLGYQFLNDRCAGKYDAVSFTDDDAFLDLGNITTMIDGITNDNPSIRCLKGDLIAMTEAPYVGKYYLWNDLWPINYVVPKYCNGQCALLNEKAATGIYKEARRTVRHGFRLEDFFYVGILRTKANITDIKATVYHIGNGQMHAFCNHLAAAAKPATFNALLQKKRDGNLIIIPSA